MAQPDDPCQIYLCVPGDIAPARLDALIDAGGLDHVSCLMLCAGPTANADTALAERLTGLAHGRDLAFVIETDIEATARCGADGVHIGTGEDAYDAARNRLGGDAIIGAACGPSRHDALTMAERGADYVAFSGAEADELAELIAWWSDVTVVPCVAWDVPDPETARRMADAGADFVAVDGWAWQHPDGPAKTLELLATTLAPGQAAA